MTFPDAGVPAEPGMGDNLFQSASLQVDYVWAATASGSDPGGETGGGGAGAGGARSRSG